MLVVCSHTGSIQANCAEALRRHAPETVYEDTSAGPDAYARMIARYWDADGDLVLIEHDNEITADVLPSFAACSRSWCTFGYEIFAPPWTTLCETGLGCTRFTPEFRRRINFRDEVLNGLCDTCGKTHSHWGELDYRVAALAEKAGFPVHVHGTVRHFHPYQPSDPGTVREAAVDVRASFRRVTPAGRAQHPVTG
jgi:hypothetical protein